MILSAVTTELTALQGLMNRLARQNASEQSTPVAFSGGIGARSQPFGLQADTFQRSTAGAAAQTQGNCEKSHDYPPLVSF